MAIDRIVGVDSGLSTVNSSTNETDGSVFKSFYDAAIDMLDETNTLQQEADQASLDFAAGKIDSIHEVMIAQEKASVALQYTVQLRDTILEAYNEIMRIQI